MEEEDLVNFVLKFIREKKGPDELVSELEGVHIKKIPYNERYIDHPYM